MLPGALNPLPEYTVPLLPVELSSVIVLFPQFATHALPPPSMAMAEGALKPPAVKPPVPETAAPVSSNFVTLELPLLLILSLIHI